ncbi:MAG TPA: protoglobin domain-containing protein [Terriglobia bacterium]|nr:protoglobin domain-containing protein [Terriglobia bacterium]
MSTATIPGYTYGSATVPKAPIDLKDLELLKKTVLFTEDDANYLRLSRDVLQDQVAAVLDVWYGFVASSPHLLHYFTNQKDNQPNAEYLAAVRKRFGQWILDTASATFDQKWLDYQFEIGRRHHRSGKNKTDRVPSVEHIPFRYLVALLYPVTFTLKPFLAKKGHSQQEVEKMHQAWIKSVLIQVILWSYPYVKEGDF